MKNIKLDKTQILLLVNSIILLVAIGAGVYFYMDLKEQINTLESKMNKESGEIVEKPKETVAVPSKVSVQCNGITKKGTRCKHKTSNPSGYCWQHVG